MTEMNIDIRHIAKLARLHVDEAEIQKLGKEMAAIIGMVENLPEFENARLELSEKDAMKLREDEVRPSMSRKEVLKNAPETEAGCIVVPKIVE
ncbi:MAG TPA: Asp-tRNA(Asn)/Glu-tRNA(Gln) amidotransferase subunit GatC [Clostridia bacterium]|nr:Asp-tRNA(Asn)/Glu-tRNA(Gln) amidotransferase subunit GatC [Clostridia bacterium]